MYLHERNTGIIYQHTKYCLIHIFMLRFESPPVTELSKDILNLLPSDTQIHELNNINLKNKKLSSD